MRKLVVCSFMSLDGYFEGPGKDVMALPIDPVFFDAHNAERLRAASTLLLGATSYRGFRDFWLPMADNPDATADQREIARLNNAIDKVVVSDSLSEDETGPWRESTRIVRRADAAGAVAALKAEPGRDILVFGSRTMWHALLAEGLVDELQVMVGARAIGDGTPLFGPGGTPSLRLTDAVRRDGSDCVLLRYAVGSAGA